MDNAGIDYGLGQSNIDQETGIRYGVISQHSLTEWLDERLENDYGSPTCPKCGNAAHDLDGVDNTEDMDTWEYGRGYADYYCESCKYVFDNSEAYPDEAIGQYLDSAEYQLSSVLDSDLMVLKSPYYTYACYCSPCVPGAGDLDSPLPKEEGIKVYCLDKTWFDNEHCQYSYWRVSDNTLVYDLNTERDNGENEG